MSLFGLVHPPAGATALIAVLNNFEDGWLFTITPAITGSVVLLVVALFANNLHPLRRYPLFW